MTEWDDAPMEAEETEVGYRSPPKATRFKTGQSGNPAGRPRGRHRKAPYETVLGQIVTIREDGTTRRVTGAEAFLLKLTQSGLEGGSAAVRDILDVIEQAKDQQGGGEPPVTAITMSILDPGSVTSALEPLRMAGNSIRTARPHGWSSNRGSSRPRWPGFPSRSVPPISASS